MLKSKYTVPVRVFGIVSALMVLMGIALPWMIVSVDEQEKEADDQDEVDDIIDEQDIPEDVEEALEEESKDEEHEFDLPLLEEDGSYSGFDLLTIGHLIPEDVGFLQYLFYGIYLLILMALVSIMLSVWGWSTVGPGLTMMISGIAYMTIFLFIDKAIADQDWVTVNTGPGMVMVIVGGMLTIIAGVLIKSDQKRLQRMEIDQEYHDRDMNIFSLALKHSYSLGRPSRDQVELLDILKTEMKITEDEAARIEDEALRGRKAGGRPMERPPPPDWDEPDDLYDGDDYPCSVCGTPLRYIDRYGDWYCDECQEYETGEDGPSPKRKGSPKRSEKKDESRGPGKRSSK